jgi:hypothetical protein
MSDKQLIVKTHWKYYRKHFIVAVLLTPIVIGVIALGYLYFILKNSFYTITDDAITDNRNGVKIQIDDIVEVKKSNALNFSNLVLHDLILVGNNTTITLKGIDNASVISESLGQLIAFKQELKDAKDKREVVQVRQDPGSLERLNDLAGMLQEGLISYEDYLQERKNFEDKQ